MKPLVDEFAFAGRRRQHGGTVCRTELVCAGEEVGVQVSVGGERHSQTTLCRGRMDGAQVATDVDDQCAPIAKIDKVRGISESFVDQRNQIDIRHRSTLLSTAVRSAC
jgi:hypothetical protein